MNAPSLLVLAVAVGFGFRVCSSWHRSRVAARVELADRAAVLASARRQAEKELALALARQAASADEASWSAGLVVADVIHLDERRRA